jgi:signal transduction histidine kinase
MSKSSNGAAGVSERVWLRSQDAQRLRHDVGQSLAVVMASTAIIDHDPLHLTEALKRLGQIRRETDWMTQLLTGDATQARPGEVDIGEIANETWVVVSGSASCSVRLVREGAAYARVSATELRRAVRNLVENAVRAAGADGFVEIRVEVRDGLAVVEVGDSGPGFGLIPAQQGLGLVTVRRVAARSGGSVTVGTSWLGGALVALQVPAVGEQSSGRDGDAA